METLSVNYEYMVNALKSETIIHAERIWNYFSSFNSVGKSDVIVVCCSYDLRVCDHACDLLKQGFAEKIIFSGFQGRWTKALWAESESEVFFKRAIANNISEKRIVLESNATNIGENIHLSRLLVPNARKVIFVTKPNTLLRVKLTVPIQWPDIHFFTSCPEIEFPTDISNIVGLFGLINEMVGDVQRIIEYSRRGYQVGWNLPAEIEVSYNYLKNNGFTHCLM